MRIRFFETFFLILIFLPLGFAAGIEPIDLTYVVPVVGVIVIIFLALSNMLSHSLSDPRLEAWVKTEMREFAAAVILIAIIIGFFISSNGVSIALTGENDYVTHSKAIMDKWIERYDSAYEYVIRAASKIRASATYSPYINIPLWYVSASYSTNPLAGIAVLLGTLSLAAQALTNAVFISESIRMLVVFLSVVVPKILLPLSFIFRMIPFTRRLGNTLISLSIAGLVFLPFSIILTDSLNGTINIPIPKIDDLGKLDSDPWAMVASEPMCESPFTRTVLGLTDPLFALLICLPLYLVPVYGAALFAICFPLVQYVIYPLMNTVFQGVMTSLLLTWEAQLSPSAYAGEVFGQVQPFLAGVNNLVLLGYINFILIATITFVGARSLSAALGGEWYMAGIQRLI